MRFDIITLFLGMFGEVLGSSMLKRAQASSYLIVALHDMREVTSDVHRTVDDTPYGGGAGMLLKVDVLDASLQKVLELPEVQAVAPEKRLTVLLCPQGERLAQPLAQKLAKSYEQITLICGHYEGFDERIRSLVDMELSIGDYVLTGGELPAMVLVDCITRLVPGVLHDDSPGQESHSLIDPDTRQILLEYPQYTRPVEYKGERVPDVLLSGNHAEIRKWRIERARERTKKRK